MSVADKHVSGLPQSPERPREEPAEQVDRPAARPLLAVAEGVAEFVQVGHDGQPAAEDDLIESRAVAAVPARSIAPPRIDYQPRGDPVRLADRVMQAVQLGDSLGVVASPRLRASILPDRGDGGRSIRAILDALGDGRGVWLKRADAPTETPSAALPRWSGMCPAPWTVRLSIDSPCGGTARSVVD